MIIPQKISRIINTNEFISIESNEESELLLFGINGKYIFNNRLTKGRNVIKNKLPTGEYIIKILYENYATFETIQIIRQ